MDYLKYKLLRQMIIVIGWTSMFWAGYANLSWATSKPLNNIIVESDWIEVFHDQELAVFHKNVVVNYNDLVMYSQEMKVKYSSGDDPSPKNKATIKSESVIDNTVENLNNSTIFDQQIEKIEFITQVHLVNTSKGENIYSDYAIYNNLTQQITATGHLKIVNQSGTLWGDEYIYDLKSKTSRIANKPKQGTGKTSDRVKIVIEQDSRSKQDTLKVSNGATKPNVNKQ